MKKHSKSGKDIGVFNDKSINAVQGKKVNEVEKFLMLAKRLIEAEMGAGKKGMVIHKGEPEEVKVKYENALRTCDRLYAYMGIKGAFSYGICKSCEHFNDAVSTIDTFGKCKLRSDKHIAHIYDTCDKHSVKGGGFGV